MNTLKDYLKCKTTKLHNINENTKLLFDNLKKNNRRLTKIEIDKYLAHIFIKSKKKYCSQMLEHLTEQHLLDSDQLTLILEKHELLVSNKWIANLTKLGMSYTTRQMSKLIKLKCDFGVETIINKYMITIDDFYNLCMMEKCTVRDMENFLLTHNIVPDDNSLEKVLSSHIKEINTLDIVKLFIKYKYKPNHDTMSNDINKILYISMYNNVDNAFAILQLLINNGAAFTKEHFKYILMVNNYNNNTILNKLTRDIGSIFYNKPKYNFPSYNSDLKINYYDNLIVHNLPVDSDWKTLSKYVELAIEKK